ncbi:MAG: hypothetical protein GEU91_02040 [Rhizobiales bacterium]|nr:hypothetical protein [Hyphomicrobiales bacterium]
MNIKKILMLALLSEPTLAAAHEPVTGIWESHPRAAITIVVDTRGARLIGPGWERALNPVRGKPVRVQLDETSWFILRLRRDGAWVGTYYHSAVRPEEKGEFKRHLMFLTRQ